MGTVQARQTRASFPCLTCLDARLASPLLRSERAHQSPQSGRVKNGSWETGWKPGQLELEERTGARLRRKARFWGMCAGIENKEKWVGSFKYL